MEEDKNESSISGIISDAKDFVSERFKNPFLLSFTFFWLLLNWRIPFLIFFSDYPVLERYDIIEGFYVWWEWVVRGLVLPLSFALGYVLLKDEVFGRIEKQTKEPYINRLKIRIDKQIEEIKAVTKRVPHEQELEDTKTKFVRYEELKSKLELSENNLDEVKRKLENMASDINVNNQTYSEFSSTMNLFIGILHKDKDVSAILNSIPKEEVIVLGNHLKNWFAMESMLTESESAFLLSNVIKFRLLDNVNESNNQKLTSSGIYVLLVSMFSKENFEGMEFKF